MSHKKTSIHSSPEGQGIVSIKGENFLFFEQEGNKITIGPMEGDRPLYEYQVTYSKDEGKRVISEMIKMREAM